MQVTIDTTELRAVAQRLGFSDRRTRAVGATVLTRVARQVEGEWRGQLADRLDRPLTITKRATVVETATAARLRAVVKLRTEPTSSGAVPAEYLAPQESGGQRGFKKFELALQRAGAMPAGYKAVPGKGAKLDAYGNVSRGQIVAVLNQLAAGTASKGYQRVIGKTQAKREQSAKRAGRVYVAITDTRGRRDLSMGIYERTAAFNRAATVAGALAGLRAVFVFMRNPTYKRRLRLVPDGMALASQQLPAQARRAVSESLARLLARGA